MRILTRYILQEFIKPFLLAVGFVGVISLLAQVFQDLQLLRDYKPAFGVALSYFACFLPAYLVLMIPLACLFSVLFCLSILSRGNELIAMRAGGMNILSVAFPILVAGLAVGFTTFWFNEAIVPRSEEWKENIREVRIKHQPEFSVNKIRQNFSIVGADGQLYYIGSFDGTRNSMTDLLMLDFGSTGHIRTRTEAKTANFEGGGWVLYSGIQREFDEKDDEVRTRIFEKMPIATKEKPADFLKDQKEAQTMRLGDLRDYIHHLRQIGSDSHKEEVYLYYRFASPFGCVILALLGVPWGWTMRKYTGAALSFFISLIAGLVYVGGTVIGRGLGESGILNPLLSVWVVNIVFAGMTPLIFAWKDR